MRRKEFYKYLLQNCNIYLILSIMCGVIGGVSFPLSMYLTQKIIDSISESTVLTCRFILYLGIVLAVDVFGLYFSDYLNTKIRNGIDRNGGQLILEKCSKLPYEYFEKNNTYQSLNRISESYKDIYMGLVHSCVSSVRLIITFLGIMYYLLLISPWILVIMVCTLVPSLILSTYATTKEFVSWESFFPFYLKARYLTELLTKRQNVKETRIFQYYRYLENAWEEVLMKFHKGQMQADLKPRVFTGICVFLQYGITIGILFMIAPQISSGKLTIGIFVAIAQAMWNFTGNFQYGLIQMFREQKEGKLFTQEFQKFLSLPERKEFIESKNVIPKFQCLELKDIWFRYSEDAPYILKGVHLSVKYGQKIGLVGENGSGKTTLIKILLGLLVPERGSILLNGVPVTDENRVVLQKITSVVFQDFSRYNLTLQESLALENPEGSGNTARMREILHTLQPEQDFLVSMKEGFETFLGKDIEKGQDLSGGQWQTIAVARSLFAKKQFRIFDEPTAALDPLAEVTAYNTIYNTSYVKTVLLVTHRLGAVVQADHIWVLADGKIAEEGTHKELLNKNGKYSVLFEMQKSWYVRESEGLL